MSHRSTCRNFKMHGRMLVAEKLGACPTVGAELHKNSHAVDCLMDSKVLNRCNIKMSRRNSESQHFSGHFGPKFCMTKCDETSFWSICQLGLAGRRHIPAASSPKSPRQGTHEMTTFYPTMVKGLQVTAQYSIRLGFEDVTLQPQTSPKQP